MYTESEPIVDMPLGAHPSKENSAMEFIGNSVTSNQIGSAFSVSFLVYRF